MKIGDRYHFFRNCLWKMFAFNKNQNIKQEKSIKTYDDDDVYLMEISLIQWEKQAL